MCGRTYRRTDMTKIIGGFCDSLNSPKMGACEREPNLQGNVVVVFICHLLHISE